MELLERIREQMDSARMPLFAVTVAAIPCPDTPVILTLHWHAFVRERLAAIPEADVVAYSSVPSSALQLNERWGDLVALDLAAMEAGWELGAWDVARAERPSCVRPGAASSEAIDCLKAFGTFPGSFPDSQIVVANAPDADDLIGLAARQGYLVWQFRPVRGGIWGEVADDATLLPDGTRKPPCPLQPVPPRASRAARTVYRFGRHASGLIHR